MAREIVPISEINRTFDMLAGLAQVPTLNERVASASEKTATITVDIRALMQRLVDESRAHSDELVAATTATGERVARAVENQSMKLN